MRITFLSGGNMATALIGGLINNGYPVRDLAVIERNAENRERLAKDFDLRCYASPENEALNCDVLVLAVKPQQMRAACAPLAGRLREQLVISIAAGLRLGDLSRWLGGHFKLVRTMPNTPALIGCGVTGLYALPGVTEVERMGAERIMQAVGCTLWVGDEAHIDAVTAVSGSGPAYVFLFIEALQKAASELGFNAKQAHLLSIETVLGAARLALHSEEPASVLRDRVTSKGGTTEAALKVMAERGFVDGVVAGILAANARGVELGEQLGKDD